MATTKEYIDFVCEQIKAVGKIRYKKLFGEYMVYIDKKPILLVCDDTVYVKKSDCIKDIMQNAESGFPYKGAKEHYILDMENTDLSTEVLEVLKKFIPIPKSNNKESPDVQ